MDPLLVWSLAAFALGCALILVGLLLDGIAVLHRFHPG